MIHLLRIQNIKRFSLLAARNGGETWYINMERRNYITVNLCSTTC